MKKILSLITALMIGASAQTFNLVKGWQLVGASQDINVSEFSNSNIVSVWTYDKINKRWKAYLSNTSIDLSKYNIDKLKKINKDEGFWVNSKNSEDLKVKDSFVEDIKKNGLKGLQNRILYFGYIDDDMSFDSGIVDFGNDNKKTITLKGKNGESGFADVIFWDKDKIYEIENDWGPHVWTLIDVDSEKNLILIAENWKNVYVFTPSKEALENYKSKFNYSTVDISAINDKYFYYIDENDNIKGIKVSNNTIEYYDIDDIEGDVDEDGNYKLVKSISLNISGNIRKISLANKIFSANTIGAMFDNAKFIKWLKALGLEEIKFTQGNIYCFNKKCYFDKAGIANLYSLIVSSPARMALKKGSPKTPTYTKLSEYLKSGEYYDVWVEPSNWIEYGYDYVEGTEIKWKDIYNTDNNSNSVGELPISVLDPATKILAEYDNGFLVEMRHDEFDYKIFYYNNVDDAKKVYETLYLTYKNIFK
jgi:hypothetical protein